VAVVFKVLALVKIAPIMLWCCCAVAEVSWVVFATLVRGWNVLICWS